MKITQTKALFAWLLFFSSTIFPLKIEEITDEEVTENDRSPERNRSISKKFSKKLPQSDSRSTPKKIEKRTRRTKTKPPAWKVIDTPRTTYFFYQNTQISGSKQSDLEEFFHAFITNNSTMKFMPPRYHDNGNVPSAIPVDILSLENRTRADEQNKHNNRQVIRNRLAKLNKKLINPWGPPVF